MRRRHARRRRSSPRSARRRPACRRPLSSTAARGGCTITAARHQRRDARTTSTIPDAGHVHGQRVRDCRRADRRGGRRRVDRGRAVHERGLLAVRDHGHRSAPADGVVVQRGDHRRSAAATSAWRPTSSASRRSRATARAQDNVISFSFANHHGADRRASTTSAGPPRRRPRTRYGLDHEYEFTDGTSACNDPMTYRADCGGQKFFRNQPREVRRVRGAHVPVRRDAELAPEARRRVRRRHADHAAADRVDHRAARPARRSRRRLRSSRVGGLASAASRRSSSGSTATSGRSADGAAFGANGPAESVDVHVPLPAERARRHHRHRRQGVRRPRHRDELADGHRDQGRAVHERRSTCATGQTCDAGHCLWDRAGRRARRRVHLPAVLQELACASGTGDSELCTQDCIADEPTSCPTGFDCLPIDSGAAGLCWPRATTAAAAASVATRRRSGSTSACRSLVLGSCCGAGADSTGSMRRSHACRRASRCSSSCAAPRRARRHHRRRRRSRS